MAKNPYINIYGGDVTAGEKDGIPISCDGSFFYPVSMLFDVSKAAPAETAQGKNCMVKKFAIRTEPGWTYSNLRIQLTQPPSETYTQWKINWYTDSVDYNHWDDYATWGGHYADKVANVNKIFYLRLKYRGRQYDYDLERYFDHFGNFRDTGIRVSASIAPIGFNL